MRIKRQALKWAMAGEYFTVHDLKEHLALDCSEATITNALKEPGAVRRAARGRGEGQWDRAMWWCLPGVLGARKVNVPTPWDLQCALEELPRPRILSEKSHFRQAESHFFEVSSVFPGSSVRSHPCADPILLGDAGEEADAVAR